MKLFKPLLTVLALAFALIFITACSSGGNAGSSSGKTTAKARTIDEIKKKAVNCESPCLEIKNRLATLTMMVLTKATLRY
ncbi:ABC transporter substrate binding protein [Streptococcus pneumoniae]|nr:ABC transporter substrate binding protein [Streptococcus pneumoniae]VPM42763.1 ABC transporter substrate binding protein [Streptococcus pneumoniae]